MFGRQDPTVAQDPAAPPGEEAFLGGSLGNSLGNLQLGIDLRPSHLEFTFNGNEGPSRTLFMNADLLAAYQTDGWTFYGEIGRQIQGDDWSVESYEHWVGYQADNGVGVRAGRFFPAYGVRHADHTAFTRTFLGFDKYDQVYGVEVSVTRDRALLQVSAGPGRADSLIDDDGRQAFTMSGRFQFDVTPRLAVVASGLYRDGTEFEPESTLTGVTVGYAPTSRVTTWTGFDVRFQDLFTSTRHYVVMNQTSVEAIRGLWLRVSPQFRWGDVSGLVDSHRIVVGADVFPRTHWHVAVSYYRDRVTFIDLLNETFLTQLHIYL